MITIKKNVYYCEYCGKRNLSSFHMKKHERGCTVNINRTCLTCGMGTDLNKIVSDLNSRYEIIAKFVKDEWGHTEELLTVKWTGAPVTLNEIKDLACECPTCTLAILRLTGMNRYYFKEHIGEFDYKGEHAKYTYRPHPSEFL